MAPALLIQIKLEPVVFAIVLPLQMIAKQAKTANAPR
jgi:hypothetical protein